MSLNDALRLFVGLYLIGALIVFGSLLAHKIAFVRRGGPEDRSDHPGQRVGIFFSEVIGQSKVPERLTAGWAAARRVPSVGAEVTFCARPTTIAMSSERDDAGWQEEGTPRALRSCPAMVLP